MFADPQREHDALRQEDDPTSFPHLQTWPPDGGAYHRNPKPSQYIRH